MDVEKSAPAFEECKEPAIRVNLRGREFSVPLSAVNRYPESLLATLCRETTGALGGDKAVNIDRNPDLFESILKIYSHSGGHLILPSAPKGCSISHLEQELDFFQLPPMDDLPLVLHCNWYKAMGDICNLANSMMTELTQNRAKCFMRDRAAFLVWFDKNDLKANARNVQLKTKCIGLPTELEGKPTYTKELHHLAGMGLKAFVDVALYLPLRNQWTVEAGNLTMKAPHGSIVLPRFRPSTLNVSWNGDLLLDVEIFASYHQSQVKHWSPPSHQKKSLICPTNGQLVETKPQNGLRN